MMTCEEATDVLLRVELNLCQARNQLESVAEDFPSARQAFFAIYAAIAQVRPLVKDAAKGRL
jgi:hypothetical protein